MKSVNNYEAELQCSYKEPVSAYKRPISLRTNFITYFDATIS